ncbi:MAG: hypothetical protein N2109_02405 [Fimbriimonadales bacterium]|nr:hypothetical protein [Fimbriimonadales bacterium]
MDDRFTETEQQRSQRLRTTPYTWAADVTYRFFVSYATALGVLRAEYRQQQTLYLMTDAVAQDFGRLFEMAHADASAEAFDALSRVQRATVPVPCERSGAIAGLSVPEFRVDAIYALVPDAEDDFPPEYIHLAGSNEPWVPVFRNA